MSRRYYKENRDKMLNWQKNYNKTHRNEINERFKRWWKRNIILWMQYLSKKFGEFPKCSICERILNWNKNPNKVYLDHKNGNESIKCSPYSWMKSHARNEKNIKILESCNFGILCLHCNGSLPTQNRKDWLLKIKKYVGEER